MSNAYKRLIANLLFLLFLLPCLAQDKPGGVMEKWQGILKYSPSMIAEELVDLCEAYPSFLSLDTIGYSVENRPILMLTMGCGNHHVLALAAIHGREYITSAFLMKDIEKMVNSADEQTDFGDYDIAEILRGCTFHLIPMMNPDGVDIAQNGAKGRDATFRKIPIAQKKLGYRSWKANANGVDLNRNFSPGWKANRRSPKGPSSEQYKGVAPETEPETRALLAAFEAVRPEAVLAFHTQGEKLFLSTPTGQDSLIARRIKELTHYRVFPTYAPYGSLQDYVDEEMNVFYACVELCPFVGHVPFPESRFYRNVFPRAAYILPEIGRIKQMELYE